MSEHEMKLMPYGFLKKYGSLIHFMRRMEQEAHVSENKEYNDFYKQVEHLNALLTDEEKNALRLSKEEKLKADNVKMSDLVRDEGDYFKR